MILQFLGFFVAGLAVNLTPCVYPMLTVTASLFKPRQSEGQTIKHSFFKALSYFLGIAVMYSSLGYFAASSGKLFGSVLQNSWVLGSVSLMMFVLALSMFGFFQLRVPDSWLNNLGGLRKANYVGLFFSGMLVGIFAAPCIGPPVLALLAAVAQHGDPIFGLSAFFVFSLGLGLPYLLLGTFSSLASKLPKAGGWLIWVERVFGVILLGFAVFYLALALHRQNPTVKKTPIFTPYSEVIVNQAMVDGKPFILDFFAEWCFGCHEMDRTVFANPMIKAQLNQLTVLRVDATNMDDPKVNDLLDKYNIQGLPTVLFLDNKGNEITEARIEGAVSIKTFERSLVGWADETGIIFRKLRDNEK